MKTKKIQLIESPRDEIKLSEEGMSFLLGGKSTNHSGDSHYYCPNKYTESTILGPNKCSTTYSSGECGLASNYCGKCSSCLWNYNK